jgi:hypothetical protein
MLDVTKMQDILFRWEQNDGGWDDETRNECTNFISEHDLPMSFWNDLLEKVPSDILERYRKLIALMVKEDFISAEQAIQEEHIVMTYGPKLLHRRGKLLADELKQKRAAKTYIEVIPHECR